MERRANKWLRIVSLLFIAGILSFLVFSGSVTLFKEPASSSYYENRILEALPPYTAAGVLDGSYFSSLNTYLQEHAAGRNTLLRLETLINLKVLRRPVVNDVVVGDDVLLGWQDFWIYDLEDLQTLAENAADRIAKHARVTEEHGGKYYFVAVPHQALAYSDAYPSYLQSHEDYYRDAAAFLTSALENRDVPFMDMWAIFRNKGVLPEVSSRVDNHFNIIGALITCRFLLDQIHADTGWDLHFLDEEYCQIEWLTNPYMGSRERKLFDLWPSDERLGIVTTVDEPPFIRTDKSSWMDEQIVSDSVYALPASAGETISYSLYMGGDWGHTEIRTDRAELPDILIYGDSFTNPVECLLWRGFDTTYSFDFRHYSEYDLDELIALYHPDIVICIRDYEAVLKSGGNGN